MMLGMKRLVLCSSILTLTLTISVSCKEEDDGHPFCGEAVIGDNCEEIEGLYRSFIERHDECETTQDCYVLNGSCEQGLGNCFEAVSNVSQEDIDFYAQTWTEKACGSETDAMQCDCTDTPDVVCSEDKTCQIVNRP